MNTGLIVGNYYRPSRSDKRQLRMFMQIKTPKKNRVWSEMDVMCCVTVERHMGAFLEKTMDSISAQFLHILGKPETWKVANRKGCGTIWGRLAPDRQASLPL